jgi:hypothetical protein
MNAETSGAFESLLWELTPRATGLRYSLHNFGPALIAFVEGDVARL